MLGTKNSHRIVVRRHLCDVQWPTVRNGQRNHGDSGGERTAVVRILNTRRTERLDNLSAELGNWDASYETSFDGWLGLWTVIRVIRVYGRN
jgi:hypothetical protein